MLLQEAQIEKLLQEAQIEKLLQEALLEKERAVTKEFEADRKLTLHWQAHTMKL